MTPPAPAPPTAAQPAVPLAGVRSAAAPAPPPAGAPTARPPSPGRRSSARPPLVRPARVPAARRNDGQITDWALAAGGGDREAADRFVRATYEDVRRFVAYLSSDSRAPTTWPRRPTCGR